MSSLVSLNVPIRLAGSLSLRIIDFTGRPEPRWRSAPGYLGPGKTGELGAKMTDILTL